MQAEFWNQKYQESDYHYGLKPNRFLQLLLESRPPGRLLFPAEGEGRNAVYAAKLGWEVYAFDQSERGRAKALELAEEQGVELHYEICDAREFNSELRFDVIALIYAHFPAEFRKELHKQYADLLKPGGEIWLEAFAPGQLEFQSGGPKNPEMLYSTEMLEADFSELQIRQSEIKRYQLDEGPGHQGLGEVVRFKAYKVVKD